MQSLLWNLTRCHSYHSQQPASTCEMELRQGYVIGNNGFDLKSAFHLLMGMLFSAF